MTLTKKGEDAHMKKVVSLLLVGAMLVGIVGCGSGQGELFGEAATRVWSEDDANHVYLDDEAIALAQSVSANGAEGSAAMRAAAKAALDGCNNQRGGNNLVWSDALEQAAMVRAQEIVTTWSHTRPNGSDWWTVNSNIMYGENLAKGYSSADAAVSAWMASPTHKANVMDMSFKTCGIAIYEVGGTWYWAQEFGY
jgi:uncharacterized protein YkwD